jgi:hypothetical protein
VAVAVWLPASARSRSCASRVAASAPSSCATRSREARGASARRARDHPLLGSQLHLRRVQGAGVPLVDAAPVGARERRGQVHGVRRVKAAHVTVAARQDVVGHGVQQPDGVGRGHVPGFGGHRPAQVLEQVVAGPRGLVRLDRDQRRLGGLGECFGRGARAAAGRVRARAARLAPHRRRDVAQLGARVAAHPLGPGLVQRGQVQRALGLASAQVECDQLRDSGQLALGRRAPLGALELGRPFAHVRADGRAAGAQAVHHLRRDAGGLMPVAVCPRHPLHPNRAVSADSRCSATIGATPLCTAP